MSEVKRLTALVTGKVQGVYFRPFVQECASAGGIVGYARNLPDGRTVEVVAEGDATALKNLLLQLNQGPPAAIVEEVEAKWSPPKGTFQDFEVR